MDELLEWMDYIEDKRQQTKVRHKLKDDIVNISWHIFLKDITDYAAISKAS